MNRSRREQAQKIPEAVSHVWRGQLLLCLFAVAIVILLGRAIDLQVLDRDFLTEEGNKRHVRAIQVPASRGSIRDRRGDPLALSAPVESVWAVPGALLGSEDKLPLVSQLLGFEQEKLSERLEARKDRSFMYLRRHMNPSEARRVKALEAPGVFLQREYRRYYPAAEVTAQLVGFTNIDNRGQEGIELVMDSFLHGEPGSRRVIKDRLGRVVDDLAQFEPPDNGQDIYLSIDLRLQYLAYRELKKAVTENQASSGMAVVLDPATGEVLAMVSYPSFNPNRRGVSGDGLRNRAATDVFEPGSTVKPLIVAKALEERVYSPGSVIATHGGRYRVGRLTVKDFRDYGDVTLARLILKSSNVGAAKIGLSLGPDRVWSLYHQLGFGESTGSGLPGENSGVLHDTGDWGEIATATASYGYGLSVTALQLARAYTVFANDGVMMPVTIYKREKPVTGKRILSARTALQVREYMKEVVSPVGTARRAAVDGYQVAGKTGTVRKVTAGGYAANIHQALFVGMVPADYPRLVSAVIIDEPRKGVYYGGAVSAPVFSSIMSGALRLLQIPPYEALIASQQKQLGERS